MDQQGVTSILLMTALLVLIYFMMIRPQKKKEKADKEMRASLKVGDDIITIGGVVGKIVKINEKSVVISTTSGNNKIEFLKSAIASVGKPSAEEQPKAKPEKANAEEEKKAPNREKTVTPKKLGKKEEKAEQPAEAEAEVKAEAEAK
jgi:preprotein translocase subunit YajC